MAKMKVKFEIDIDISSVFNPNASIEEDEVMEDVLHPAVLTIFAEKLISFDEDTNGEMQISKYNIKYNTEMLYKFTNK
jgi:hypothetical protein